MVPAATAFLLGAAALVIGLSHATAPGSHPYYRSHLLLDPRTVDRTRSDNTTVTLGPVAKANGGKQLFAEDQPWEGANRNTYPTAAFDPLDKMWKIWYNTNTRCPPGQALGFCPHLSYPAEWLPAVQGAHETATLYAESADGLVFTKPNLGIVSWNGSTSNNIVLDAGSQDYNRGVLLDLHETNLSRRFKLFGGINSPACSPTPGCNHLFTVVSADGKVWTDRASAASMHVAADTANNVLWDDDLQEYIAFTRRHCTDKTKDGCDETDYGERREARSTSKTFLGGWSNATQCAHGEAGVSCESADNIALLGALSAFVCV